MGEGVTKEEIRDTFCWNSLLSPDAQREVMLIMALGEIAAQLAEMNEEKKMFGSVKEEKT